MEHRHVVLSAGSLSFRLGRDAADPGDRYAWAEDVVAAVRALWSAWDGVERRADRTSGRWLDAAPADVHLRGRFGRIDGTLNLSPEPHDRLLLAQAGSSPTGLRFAVRHADQTFTVQSGIEEAKAFRARARQLASEAERSPDDIAVLPGLVPFIAPTQQEAEDRLVAMTKLVGMDHIVPKLERFTGLAFAHLDPDARVPHGPDDLRENVFSNSRARLLISEAERSGLTLQQFAGRFAASRGHLLVIGTGEDVADTMHRWIEEDAADGFNVMSPLPPGDLERFGESVIPLLDRTQTTR